MNKLIDAVRTFLSGVEYIEQEENANYVVTKEDKELLKEAIDTLVKELEKPLPTDEPKTNTSKDMEVFAEWCMKNYKRMHDMNEYKGRFDSDPSGKRYNISNLRELWEKEREAK